MKKFTIKSHVLIVTFFVAALLSNNSFSNVPDTLHVVEDVFVSQCSTWEIPKGTVVLFHGYFNINIEGNIIAEGTEDEPIIFTATDTLGIYDTYKPGGGWNGIRLNGRSESEAIFKHCIFEFSKVSSADYIEGGALRIIGPKKAIIENSVFRHNYAYTKGGAIYVYDTEAVIKNCLFHNNTVQTFDNSIYAYGGAVFMMKSNVEIAWSEFYNNFSEGIGGAVAIEEANPTIYNCIINANDAPLGGGIGVLRADSDGVISNNLITNNTAMFFGGGIAFIDASVVIANNNIMNNYAGYGGGLYFFEGSAPKFFNNIIRNNTSYPNQINQIFIWDVNSAPDFYNNNLEGGLEGMQGGAIGEAFLGSFENNIDEDPLFEETDFWFELNSESPCINAGYEFSDELGVFEFDLLGNPRIKGERIDIGVFEFQIIDEDVSIFDFEDLAGNNELKVNVFPNPFANYVHLEFNNSSKSSVANVRLYDAVMNELLYFRINLNVGRNTIPYSFGNKPSGVYFLRVEVDGNERIIKLIKK
ncbi:MAG: T9SS type A sorting domain-containing protein [Bacteroidetes bacterium]|nr:T9SS type A sorting domain-containing protein [Bacteroidota bacterium]